MINNEVLIELMKLLSSDLLWLYFALIIIGFYLILSLITWNFMRPLKFLGIPSIIAGLMLIITYFVIELIPLHLSDVMIKVLHSSTKPVLNIGLVCLGIGIAMLALYKVFGVSCKNKIK